MFDRKDIVPEKSALGLVGHSLQLTSVKPGYRTLVWFIIITLAILSAVTAIEGRFWYGSVTMSVPGLGKVLGMSYMGDTMVWPLTILVPICLVLTFKAAQGTADLLNFLCSKAYFSSRSLKPANLVSVLRVLGFLVLRYRLTVIS